MKNKNSIKLAFSKSESKTEKIEVMSPCGRIVEMSLKKYYKIINCELNDQ